ncbi:MAG: type II toxin-antitoxin system VapC family toxin [Pseudomonadota bacterium]
MIAVDTSALMAIVLDESQAEACATVLATEPRILISAATIAETLIVAARRNVRNEVEELIEGLGLEVIHVTPSTARRVASVYERWGKGVHPAALNFGDCFAYDVARTHECRLLYVGSDFARTDIEGVL